MAKSFSDNFVFVRLSLTELAFAASERVFTSDWNGNELNSATKPRDTSLTNQYVKSRKRAGALVMRWPGVVGFDVFQFHGFQHGSLAGTLFFQMFERLALFDTLCPSDLMFQMCDVRFKLFRCAGWFPLL